MSARSIALWLCMTLASPGAIAASTSAPTGLRHDVVFTAYSPLASSAELMRRLLSPLEAMRIRRQLALKHQALRAQPVDLAQEKFVVYVPPRAPPGGFALLVFVPPWEDARMPQDWLPALARSGTIFVSAAHSGNDADVLNRREPLALVAALNIMQRYRVDSQRVYIGGFSGGSKVALRLAIAYSDLFHGALLDAGSDTIGNPRIPLPSADLLHRFQQSTRVVYLTGERDYYHQAEDARSRASLQQWCEFNVENVTMPRIGHEPADSSGLDEALNELGQRASPDAGKLAQCRAAIGQEVGSKLKQVESLNARGKREDARAMLERIDARYGGIAMPRSIDLFEQLETKL